MWQILNGTEDRVKCEFPLRPSPDDLKELKRLTRDIFQDASCLVKADVARQIFVNAVELEDHKIIVPPQSVECEVVTSTTTYPVTFSFSPEVEFKKGIATRATPGMSKVSGVTVVLSWPVRKWINVSDTIEDAMLRVVNAFVKRQRD